MSMGTLACVRQLLTASRFVGTAEDWATRPTSRQVKVLICMLNGNGRRKNEKENRMLME